MEGNEPSGRFLIIQLQEVYIYFMKKNKLTSILSGAHSVAKLTPFLVSYSKRNLGGFHNASSFHQSGREGKHRILKHQRKRKKIIKAKPLVILKCWSGHTKKTRGAL
jgi:hypothetical protein